MKQHLGRRTVTIAGALLLATAPTALAAEEAEADAATPALDHPLLGEPAPAFSLPTLDGETFDLADQEGSYLVIHFGASW